MFFAINFSHFIVQVTNQFDTLMLAEGIDNPLFATIKPRLMNGLIVSDHGFIFKENSLDIIIQEFFLQFRNFVQTALVFPYLLLQVHRLVGCRKVPYALAGQ